MFPQQPVKPGGIELFEFAAGALAPIAVPEDDHWLQISEGAGVIILRYGDRILLLVAGLPALEKVDGKWRRSELLDPLASTEIGAVESSPSGDRLCATTSKIKPAGGREDAVAWVLGPDAASVSLVPLGERLLLVAGRNEGRVSRARLSRRGRGIGRSAIAG